MPPYSAEETMAVAASPLHLKHEIASSEEEEEHNNSQTSPGTPSTPLHLGALACFNEGIKKRPERLEFPSRPSRAVPSRVVSEPRPLGRQRVGSAGCIPSKLFEETRDEIESYEMEPLELPLGLRQRKSTRTEPERVSPTIRVEEDELTMRRQGGTPRPRGRWIIPAEHHLKVLWDIVTVILSLANAHATHVSIGKRNFGDSKFMMFCSVWFLIDLVLNFVTERKTAEGMVLRDYRSICARYLTSWFAVDVLSLLPWECLYVQPIFDIQKRRGFFQKSFFRSKAVVRVTTHLRGRHFRWFGTAAKHAKHHGIGASRLLRLVIKYLPKYVLFFRNMKGAVAVRVLRQVHWCRRFYRNIIHSDMKGDGMTGSLTRDDFEDDLSSKVSQGDKRPVRLVYEDWEHLDEDDDDGVPL